MVLVDVQTGEERPLPAFLDGRVNVGDLVRLEGRQWRVVDPTADSVT